MTAIHSAWLLSNIHLAHEAAQASGLAGLTPATTCLAVVLSHSAYRNGTLTITMPDAAEQTGIRERSVKALYGTLVTVGILATSNRRGRYVLGPFWKHMEYDQGFQFQPAQEAADKAESRTAKKTLTLTRWDVERPEYWDEGYDTSLGAALEQLPGFDNYIDGTLDVLGPKLSPEVLEVLERFRVIAQPRLLS